MTAVVAFDPHEDVTLFDDIRFIMPDVTLPRWRIDKDGGQFLHSFGDVTQSLRVAIIKVDRSRTFWPEKFKKGNQVICRSHNTLHPENRDPNTNKYGMTDSTGKRVCEGCPMSLWFEENGERIKPPCSEDTNFLLLDLDTGMLGVLTLRRTRARVAQDLMGFWAITNMRFEVCLTTEKINGQSGNWYGVKFKRGDKFTDEQRNYIVSLYQQYKVWNLSAVAVKEDEEEDMETPRPDFRPDDTPID